MPLLSPVFFMLARYRLPHRQEEQSLVALERRIARELDIREPRNVRGPAYYPPTYAIGEDAWRVAAELMERRPS